MTKFKSLVFRELKLSRKHYLGAFALILLFGALMVLCVFVAGGEGVKNGEHMDAFALMMAYGFAAISAACAAGDNGVFKADMAAGWHSYFQALPVTSFEKTAARYAVKVLFILLGFAAFLLGTNIIFAAGAGTFSASAVFCFFILLDFFLIFDIVYQAIMLRANDMKSLKKMGVIAGGVVVAVFTVLDYLPTGTLPFDEDVLMTDMETMQSPAMLNRYLQYLTIPDTWGYIGIAVTLILLTAGFIIAMKTDGRKAE